LRFSLRLSLRFLAVTFSIFAVLKKTTPGKNLCAFFAPIFAFLSGLTFGADSVS
jgi:hypothetical protein